MVLKRSQRSVVVFVIAMLLIAMSFSVCGVVSAEYSGDPTIQMEKDKYDFGNVPVGKSKDMPMKMTYTAIQASNLEEGDTIKIYRDKEEITNDDPVVGGTYGFSDVNLEDGTFTATFYPNSGGQDEQKFFIGIVSDNKVLASDEFTVTGNGVENKPIVSPQTADPATAIPVIGLLLSGAGIIIFSRKKITA